MKVNDEIKGALAWIVLTAYVLAGAYIWANKVLLPPAEGAANLPALADTTRWEILR
jgi:hypothetical protein